MPGLRIPHDNATPSVFAAPGLGLVPVTCVQTEPNATSGEKTGPHSSHPKEGPNRLRITLDMIKPYLGIPLTLRLKIAHKPSILWSLGSKTLTYESLEPSGKVHCLLTGFANPLIGAGRWCASATSNGSPWPEQPSVGCPLTQRVP